MDKVILLETLVGNQSTAVDDLLFANCTISYVVYSQILIVPVCVGCVCVGVCGGVLC